MTLGFMAPERIKLLLIFTGKKKKKQNFEYEISQLIFKHLVEEILYQITLILYLYFC